MNVVIVIVDTLRWDALACYGHPYVKTPGADRLANEGIRFTNAFVEEPITGASHTCVITGMRPRNHGVRYNYETSGSLPRDKRNLLDILAGNGYAVDFIHGGHGLMWGSVHLPTSNEPGTPQARVFIRRINDIMRARRAITQLEYEYLRAGGEAVKADVHQRSSRGRQKPPDERISSEACQWLDQHHQQPFCLYVHFQHPHGPMLPPEPYRSMYDPDWKEEIYDFLERAERRGPADVLTGPGYLGRDRDHFLALYEGEVSYTDNCIKQILEKLDMLGHVEDTIFVLCSDHGEHFGDRFIDGNPDWPLWSKPSYLYDNFIRVPLIIRYPPLFEKGTRIEGLVQNIDITPTILNLLHVPLSPDLDGISLLPLVTGEQDSIRNEVYAEFTGPGIVSTIEATIRTKRWKYMYNMPLLLYRGGGQPGGEELYNVGEDPAETKNLVEDKPNIAEGLRSRLYHFLKTPHPRF